MVDLFSIDNEKLNTGMRLLRDALQEKGWSAEVPYVGSVHCFIDRNDERNPIHIFSATPPTTSFAAAHLANDKYATYKLIERIGVRQPETIVITDENDIGAAIKFLEKFSNVIVKPIDGGHGKGITTNITKTSELKEAISVAIQNTSSKKAAIAQRMLLGDWHDIRIVCINYQFVAAICRVAASVVGDGAKSIGELIEFENQTKRGKAYFAKYAFIDVEKAKKYLSDRIDVVPMKGEKVKVMDVANYGQGGELIDITDDIPDWLKRDSESVARASELLVCGVDFLANKNVKSDSSKEDVEIFLIENNKCPSLAIHDKPTVGISRGVVKKYVDYLETI
jgi:D-alanine-D-alanine ligase and related ATP-grasp enzymes